MDEPTAAVDNAGARAMHEAVARAHAGRTLIVITHDEHDLDRYDRVLVLQDGLVAERSGHRRAAGDGPPPAALASGSASGAASVPHLALVETRHG